MDEPKPVYVCCTCRNATDKGLPDKSNTRCNDMCHDVNIYDRGGWQRKVN